MEIRRRGSGNAEIPATALLEHWRSRRLYARRPPDLGWVQAVWMLGGIPLIAIFNAVGLSALPIPGVVRERIRRSIIWAAATLLILAMVSPALTLDDDTSGARVTLVIFASHGLGLAFHVGFGGAITRAYRSFGFWGGKAAGRVVFILLPLIIGVLLELAIFFPLIEAATAIGDLA